MECVFSELFAPSNFTSIEVTKSSIQLQWSRGSNSHIDAVSIFYNDSESGALFPTIVLDGQASIWYNVTSLASGHNFCFVVQFASYGNRANSSAICRRTSKNFDGCFDLQNNCSIGSSTFYSNNCWKSYSNNICLSLKNVFEKRRQYIWGMFQNRELSLSFAMSWRDVIAWIYVNTKTITFINSVTQKTINVIIIFPTIFQRRTFQEVVRHYFGGWRMSGWIGLQHMEQQNMKSPKYTISLLPMETRRIHMMQTT